MTRSPPCSSLRNSNALAVASLEGECEVDDDDVDVDVERARHGGRRIASDECGGEQASSVTLKRQLSPNDYECEVHSSGGDISSNDSVMCAKKSRSPPVRGRGVCQTEQFQF